VARTPTVDEMLDGKPRWVAVLWRTPAARLVFALAWVAGATYILVRAVTDPFFFDSRRAEVAFVVAPMLLIAFGVMAAEAAHDLVRRRDREVLVLMRGLVRMQSRFGWWLAAYVVATGVAFAVLHPGIG
jgi:hypothetical protein